MDTRKSRIMNRKFKKRTKSFTEALKEKYCVEDEPTFDFIIVSPKRKSNGTEGELAHLRTVVLNEMDVTRAEIPPAGLRSLCPNVVDLDLANNLLESWHELLDILAHLPRVKYVNVSGNKLRLASKENLPDWRLTVENLALNGTGSTIEEVVRLSQLMPALKELHLCGNDYNDLADIDNKIDNGAFSSLECMRLNNNGITSWSEVWKLRNLPQLKYLILSGNPVQDIFYKINSTNDDYHSSHNSKEKAANLSNAKVVDVWQIDGPGLMDTRADLVDADDDDDDEDKDLVDDNNDITDDADDSFNGACSYDGDIDAECLRGAGNGLGDDEEDDNDDDDDDDGCNDEEFDSNLDVRPVSRFGFHQDPDVVLSDAGSDTEQDITSKAEVSSSSSVQHTANANRPSGNINIPQVSGGSKKKVHNTNFNNSRSARPARSSPFEDSSSGSSNNLTPADLALPGFPDPLAAGGAVMPGVGPGSDLEEEDNPGDWPRLAAEQFLYDLIDQLDLGEAGSSTAASSILTSAASSFASLSSTAYSSSVFSFPTITTSAASVQSRQQVSWSIPNSARAFQPFEEASSFRQEDVPSSSNRAASFQPRNFADSAVAFPSYDEPSRQEVSLLSSTSSRVTATVQPQQPLSWNIANSAMAFEPYDEPSRPQVSHMSSVDSRVASLFPPSSHHIPDTNQNAATGGDNDAYINKILNDETAYSDDQDNLFAQIYSDDDFIPRSVSMMDDDDKNFSPPPGMPLNLAKTNLSASKPNVQRRLFGLAQADSVPIGGAISHHPPDSSLNTVDRPSQSESDSCSDCEAEQHGATAALRLELANAANPEPSPPAPPIPHSVDGPNSWLEANRSFSTSVRDSGEGYSITTTRTEGARVVVTGLDNATITQDMKESCSCEENSNTDTPAFFAQNQNSVPHSQSTAGVLAHSDTTHPPDGDNDTANSTTVSAPPFHQLQMLCLSNASLSQWDHLKACMHFPKLHNIRLKSNPLYSAVNSDDRRKLYIASLPKVTILNGSEVTTTEREKAERFYLRYFMDSPEKPGFYHTLVAKHGPPVKLVDIDLRAGYQEWATLTFKCEGCAHFTRRLHLVEPVGRLRSLVSQVLGLPKWCFVLHHHPCGPSHPECERETVELRCEALPMSRFDFAEGDEIIVEVKG